MPQTPSIKLSLTLYYIVIFWLYTCTYLIYALWLKRCSVSSRSSERPLTQCALCNKFKKSQWHNRHCFLYIMKGLVYFNMHYSVLYTIYINKTCAKRTLLCLERQAPKLGTARINLNSSPFHYALCTILN